jgi:hypothetical protein
MCIQEVERLPVKVKVKVALEQPMKAQRGSRDRNFFLHSRTQNHSGVHLCPIQWVPGLKLLEPEADHFHIIFHSTIELPDVVLN